MRLQAALLLFFSLIMLEGRSQDNLGSAFRLKEQQELRKLLPKGEVAVFFSGVLLANGVSAEWHPSPDFRHLVGEDLPGAALVVLSDSLEWAGKRACAFLFTPGQDEARRAGLASASAPKGPWLELAMSQWEPFCGQLLAGPQVRRIHLRDEYLVVAGNHRVMAVGEPVTLFFSKLEPGFPFSHEASILYKELQNTSDNNMDDLRQKINSFFAFYGFPLTTDPILQRAVHASGHKELQELRNEVAALKVDLVTLPRWMTQVSQVKTADELAQVTKAKAAAVKLMAHAQEQAKPADAEQALTAKLGQRAMELGADRPPFIRVAAADARAYPLGDAQMGTLPAAEGGSGSLVTVELEVEASGYTARMCRTWPMGGSPKAAHAKLATLLNESHEELVALLKPGASLSQVVAGRSQPNDKRMKAAGVYKTDAGPELAPLFHDVQLLGTDYSNENLPEKLAPGMILYVKTGIYLQGTRGLNPEYLGGSMERGDMVRITDSGCEVLTQLGAQ